MAEVILSSEDLIVIGGPTSVSVDVDFGVSGIRGSRIYSVGSDPRLTTTEKPEDLIPYDLAMVTTPSEPDYLTVYQKIGTSAEDWIQLAALLPNVFSTKIPLDFTSGVAVGSVPVSQVLTVDSYEVERFSVQYEIESDAAGNNYPISSSISLSVQELGGEQYLVAAISAIQFTGSSWEPIDSESRYINFFVTAI